MPHYTDNVYRVLVYETEEEWENKEPFEEISIVEPTNLGKLVDKYTEELFQQDWYRCQIVTRNFRLLVADINSDGNVTKYLTNDKMVSDYVDSLSNFIKYYFCENTEDKVKFDKDVTFYIYKGEMNMMVDNKDINAYLKEHPDVKTIFGSALHNDFALYRLYSSISDIGRKLFDLEDTQPHKITYVKGTQEGVSWSYNSEWLEVSIRYAA